MNDIDNLILLPAILFPAIPLMMVNFGNRYNSLSSLIRKIHDEFINKKIFSEKNKQTYLKILDDLKIEPQNFLMVGNSFKSDVLPVLEIGGSGIYIPYKILWEYENINTNKYSKRYIKLDKILDITSILN